MPNGDGSGSGLVNPHPDAPRTPTVVRHADDLRREERRLLRLLRQRIPAAAFHAHEFQRHLQVLCNADKGEQLQKAAEASQMLAGVLSRTLVEIQGWANVLAGVAYARAVLERDCKAEACAAAEPTQTRSPAPVLALRGGPDEPRGASE